MKRNAVSCPQSSHVLMREPSSEHTQTSQQIKETVCDCWYEDNKHEGAPETGVEEDTVM